MKNKALLISILSFLTFNGMGISVHATSVPIQLTAAATPIDVSIPEELKLNLNSGTIDIDDLDMEITNNSNVGVIEIDSIEFNTINDWTFISGSSEFGNLAANSKKLYITSNISDNEEIVDSNTTLFSFDNLNINPKEKIDVHITGKSAIRTTAIVNEGIMSAVISLGYKETDAEEETIDYILFNPENFPDEKFRDFLENWSPPADPKDELWTSEYIVDGKIKLSNLAKVKKIEAYYSGISGVKDFTGIEYFTSLRTLDISDNPITNLNVSKNIELRYLEVKNTDLTYLDISNLINLISLRADHSFIENLILGNHPSLTLMEINNNYLREINVSGLPDYFKNPADFGHPNEPTFFKFKKQELYDDDMGVLSGPYLKAEKTKITWDIK